MIRSVFLAMFLIFGTASVVPQAAVARTSLPDEGENTRKELEPLLITLLRFGLAAGFSVGLTCLIHPKTRTTGSTFLMGSACVVCVLLLFTDYMPTVAKPLKEILGGNAKTVGDLLKTSGE